MNLSQESSGNNLVPSEIIDEESEFKTSIEFTEIMDADCLTRFYKKLTFGYTIQTNISIISNILNIFILSLPYLVSLNGISLSILIILYTFASSYFSLYCLLDILLKTKVISYHHLLHSYANKYIAMLYDVINILYIFGKVLLYQYILFNISNRIIRNVFLIEKSYILLIIYVGLFLLIVIISSIPVINNKRALVQIITLSMLVIVLIIIVITAIINLINKSNSHTNKDTKWFDINANMFLSYAISICIFCGAHNYIVPIYNYFELKSQKRINEVLFKSQTISISVVIIFFIVLYLSVSDNNIKMIILLNDKDETIIAFIVQFVFCLLIIMYIATDMESFIYGISQLFTSTPHVTRQQQGGLRYLIMTIFILGIGWIINGILYNVNAMFEMLVCLIGGLCLGFISFVFPGILYEKVMRNDGNLKIRIVSKVIMVINGGISIATLIYGVFYLINHHNNKE